MIELSLFHSVRNLPIAGQVVNRLTRDEFCVDLIYETAYNRSHSWRFADALEPVLPIAT